MTRDTCAENAVSEEANSYLQVGTDTQMMTCVERHVTPRDEEVVTRQYVTRVTRVTWPVFAERHNCHH